MLETIEKLKQEKHRLTAQFEAGKAGYKSEVGRLDRAIRNFERGLNELEGTTTEKSKRPPTIEEIEKILSSGPKHLKEIVAELNSGGREARYQSVSGLLQTYAKEGKRFIKVAPATYAMIPAEARIDDEKSTERVVVYEEESAGAESE